jgi:hypothetical protein
MLLVFSFLLLALTCFSFGLNHIFPFSIPISSLIYEQHGWVYYPFIACIIAAFGIYSIKAFKLRILADQLMLLLIVTAFCLLLFINNNMQPAHNILALSAMGAVSLHSLILARRHHDRSMWSLGLLSFWLLSVIFSEDNDVLGYAEGGILVCGLVVYNADYYQKTNFLFIPEGLGRFWRFGDSPGPWAGLCWSIANLVDFGLNGFLAHSLISGPVVVVITWTGGFIAWRYDLLFRFRLIALTGSSLLVALLFMPFTNLHFHLVESVATVLVLVFFLVVAFLFDAYGDTIKA